LLTPARAFIEDHNYIKNILKCEACGWFGLASDGNAQCPFCGNGNLLVTRQMLKPWGFAPRNAESIEEAQLNEEYTFVQQPLYSTLPDSDTMSKVAECDNIRMATRRNQRIIMINKGKDDKGFMVCKDCGAAMPGNDADVLSDISRPYKSNLIRKKCRHFETINVNLGYDFITDMLVLEFAIDTTQISTAQSDNPWLIRAAQSLAEAFRLAVSKKLDVEFTELVTGYRFRKNEDGTYIDIYVYDSLSSGAGYAVSVGEMITELLMDVKDLLLGCNCDSACYECLKHYRNQYVHGVLDRFAALDLLLWGIEGKKASPIDLKKQAMLLQPLGSILTQFGCKIVSDELSITITKNNMSKQLVVYPAMWCEPYADKNEIYISDAYLKYARPYAVKKIIEGFK
jgi:hypothetical protein